MWTLTRLRVYTNLQKVLQASRLPRTSKNLGRGFDHTRCGMETKSREQRVPKGIENLNLNLRQQPSMHDTNVQMEQIFYGSERFSGGGSEVPQTIPRRVRAMWMNEERSEVQCLQHQMGSLLGVLRHEKELVRAGETAAECEWRRRADTESKLYRCLRELSRVEGERDAAILTANLLRINRYDEFDSERYTPKTGVLSPR